MKANAPFPSYRGDIPLQPICWLGGCGVVPCVMNETFKEIIDVVLDAPQTAAGLIHQPRAHPEKEPPKLSRPCGNSNFGNRIDEYQPLPSHATVFAVNLPPCDLLGARAGTALRIAVHGF